MRVMILLLPVVLIALALVLGIIVNGIRRVSRGKAPPISDEVREILSIAQDLTRRAKHNTVTPEHLLLAIADSPRAEETLGIDPLRVREGLRGKLRAPKNDDPEGDRAYSNASFKAIDGALNSARTQGADEAGPRHLVDGILAQKRTKAAKLLESLGVAGSIARS